MATRKEKNCGHFSDLLQCVSVQCFCLYYLQSSSQIIQWGEWYGYYNLFYTEEQTKNSETEILNGSQMLEVVRTQMYLKSIK